MNLHRIKEDLIDCGLVEEFVNALPGFVAVPEELWAQLRHYVESQRSKHEAALRFLQGRPVSTGRERTEERLQGALTMQEAMETRTPVDLPSCNCWFASNEGADHPDRFNCSRCRNTGKVQLQ